VDEEGSTGPTSGRMSQRFSRVEASPRAGLVRVGTQSRVLGVIIRMWAELVVTMQAEPWFDFVRGFRV
jgi:hypothetical protein